MSDLLIKQQMRDMVISACARANRLLGVDGGDRIIALHDTPDRGVFREKMQWLKGHYELVSLAAILEPQASQSRQRVALTFDDGYENWHEVAASVLDELDIPAVFFVNSGLVGLSGAEADRYVRQHLRRSRNLMPISLASIINLAQHPLFEIGGHTRYHVNLASFPNTETALAVVHDDKKKLEQMIGASLRWFAFPFGGREHISPVAMEAVQRSGYEAAFSIIPDRVDDARSYYSIGRVCLELNAAQRNWAAYLHGGYDLISKFRPMSHRYG